MMKSLMILLCLAVVAGGAYYGRQVVRLAELVELAQPADPVRHAPAAPTIEEVRELASLVTLDVPISDIHISRMSGLTGGLKMAVAVHGDVQIATNLRFARFDNVDAGRRRITLILPHPAPGRPRLDHEKTRIIEIERSGLWNLQLGQAGERELSNRAFAAAQRVLLKAADQPRLVERARDQTEEVMRGFFGALGWTVAIEWDDSMMTEVPAEPDPATSTAASE